MDAEAWDRRYAGSPLVWSTGPNATIERETAGLTPGRAVDLASGEGRNAIWLAEHGWRVTAVDFSEVATRRAAELAAERLGDQSDRVTVTTADVLTWRAGTAEFDLAILAYLQLPAVERRTVHRAAAAALAPGGTFLLVAHHLDNLTSGVGGPQDASVLFSEADVLSDLDGTGLMLERAERVERTVAPGGETHRSPADVDRPALDVLVRARRQS